ncbi:hypothetical protein CSQ96_18435 [Janthinobacterium sp. BJB412]|nr:hypothetical protein CSQ96_18435 [Janthinobacterium sp. BJB412]
MRAYVVAFSTSDSAFMSNPDAATDKAAYIENTGKRSIWENKFCSGELKAIMRHTKVSIVTGDLQNREGQTQFMAMCSLD